MAYDARLATCITAPVDRRLRMLALLQGKPISHVLTQVLDEALPDADELVSQFRDYGRSAPAEAVA